MRTNKSKEKKPKIEAPHAGQVVWTVAVAMTIALILIQQSSGRARSTASTSVIPSVLEPQRNVAAETPVR